MNAKVILTITSGACKGERFEFSQRETILVGRAHDCDINLPDDDILVSRRHFSLDVDPPRAALRDLGSRNGTYVNGVKYGGRQEDALPDQGAQYETVMVALKHNDLIRIGETTLRIEIEQPAVCASCRKNIPADEQASSRQPDGSYLCLRCLAEVPWVTGLYPPEVGPDALAKLMGLLEQRRKTSDHQAPEIPGYETLKLLGEGGMGRVYLLRETNTGYLVELRTLHPKLALIAGIKTRLDAEIEIMKALQHPNLVALCGEGVVDEMPYILVEYCELGSVDQLARKHAGVLSLAEASGIVLQTLSGLAYMHQHAYVHRDVKPQNIVLTGSDGDPVAKLSNYSLAKKIDTIIEDTVDGEFMGTVLFMSRDQVVKFNYCGPAADVWAMGATFYNLLTGKYPRDFVPNKDPILQVMQNPVVPVRRRDPSIPIPIAHVIDTALSEDPEQFYPDATAMLVSLERALGESAAGEEGEQPFWYD